MTYDIKVLDLGSADIDHNRIVSTGRPGDDVRVPILGFLLLGGPEVVLVDTGFRHPDILKRLGMRGYESDEQKLENQLSKHGVKKSDVRYVLLTHLHIDHGGKVDQFDMSTTAIISRREMEYSASGLSGPSYPPEDVTHMIQRLHVKDALWPLDLAETGGEQILPGIRCEHAGGHTEGSLVVYVDTADGLACLCGDIIYRVDEQLFSQKSVLRYDPVLSGNTVVTRRSEKASIKRVLNRASIVYPSHDKPFRVVDGRPVRPA